MKKESKGPPARKEEKLEVGLERYEKSQSKAPQWVIDYGAWIVISVVFFVVVLPFGIFGWRLSGSEPVAGGPGARLVALSQPSRIWVDGSSTKVRAVQVKVGNQGLIQAQGISVAAIVRGQTFQLTGATELDSGKMAIYSGDINLSLSNDEAMQIIMNCATCQ